MHTVLPPLQLVAGEFDLRENFLIREPSVVLLLLELLPKLSDQLQVLYISVCVCVYVRVCEQCPQWLWNALLS